jgi:hypothetical protein
MCASAAQTAAKPAPTLTLNVISNEAKDPICGMTVEKSKAKHKSEFQGKAVLLLLRRMQREI